MQYEGLRAKMVGLLKLNIPISGFSIKLSQRHI